MQYIHKQQTQTQSHTHTHKQHMCRGENVILQLSGMTLNMYKYMNYLSLITSGGGEGKLIIEGYILIIMSALQLVQFTGNDVLYL